MKVCEVIGTIGLRSVLKWRRRWAVILRLLVTAIVDVFETTSYHKRPSVDPNYPIVILVTTDRVDGELYAERRPADSGWTINLSHFTFLNTRCLIADTCERL